MARVWRVKVHEAHAVNAAIRTIGIRHRALADSLLGGLGLHTGQEVLLLELGAKGPRSQSQLATSSGCEPPTISGSVRKLEAAGFVHRRASSTDARVSMVELTDRGRDLLPRLTEVWRQLADDTVAGLTATSLDQLTEVLTDLAASLTATSPRPPRDLPRGDRPPAGPGPVH